mmetsp:Transcript_9014/g.17614  ORF Transcript_9014/g.17614 Transcript_9014/m.17614 type:complete len:81 (+) Transcript_9014:172-414(+)
MAARAAADTMMSVKSQAQPGADKLRRKLATPMLAALPSEHTNPNADLAVFNFAVNLVNPLEISSMSVDCVSSFVSFLQMV